MAVQHRRLGNHGVLVSNICLGTMTYGAKSSRSWVLEEPESRPFFEKALEAGINSNGQLRQIAANGKDHQPYKKFG